MIISFGEYELDPEMYELRRAGEVVNVEPQVFDVLRYLVAHRDGVVSKEELLDEVWGDRFVSESALTTRIKQARRAVGDDGATQRVIRTVRGRGFRFVAAVQTSGDKPSVDGSGHTAGRLPTTRARLHGRDDERAHIARLLDEHRLVTLLGFGGMGKTRLSVAVAEDIGSRFADGVAFVDLVPTSDAASVEVAIADGSGIARSAGDTRRELVAALAARDQLLLLDNCEHVAEEVALVVDDLLDSGGPTRVLATSRVPLQLRDEVPFAVGSLAHTTERDVDDGGRFDLPPAVALFTDVARRTGVEISPDELPEVWRICGRLDGMPLAIELAAAQLAVIPPRELGARLDDRFDVLRRSTDRGVADRHAGLDIVLADTWSMLDEPDRRLVALLSVFPSRFSLTDVEQLLDVPTGEAVARLRRLIDRSLLVRDSGPRPFRLLESVRLFASGATEHDGMVFEHVAWCRTRLGDDFSRQLNDYELAEWCAAHLDDIDLVEQALWNAGDVDTAATVRSATCLALHCDAGTRAADALRRIDRLVLAVDDPGIRCRLHITGTHAAMAARDPASIARHGSAAVDAAEFAADDALLAVALVMRSWSTVFEDVDVAIDEVERAAALAIGVADDEARSLADGYRCFHLMHARRHDESEALSRQVIDRTGPVDRRNHSDFVAMAALACNLAVDRPEQVAALVPLLLACPSVERTMWANEIVAATIHASMGSGDLAVELVDRIVTRLHRAGLDGYPDLLLPIAAYAHRVDEPDRARRWLRAVRDAGRPTQSFQATSVYRRCRAAVGLADESPLDGATIEEIGTEAIEWLRVASGASAG